MEQLLAPIVGGIISAAALVAVALLAFRGNRATSDANRAPDTDTAWAEADRARARMHAFEDWGYLMRGGWKGYARRMQERHGEEAASLTAAERKMLETEPPPPVAAATK